MSKIYHSVTELVGHTPLSFNYYNMTVIMVTHDVDEAIYMSD